MTAVVETLHIALLYLFVNSNNFDPFLLCYNFPQVLFFKKALLIILHLTLNAELTIFPNTTAQICLKTLCVELCLKSPIPNKNE